jgi:thiamine transport system permease protein
MLGFGFVIAFDQTPVDFRSAPWIVPVVQALVAMPFVVRIVAPMLRAIDERQREAAAMLGASPGRVRREIDLPIAARALAVAAGFAFAISLGEFGATVFLARPDRPTLPVAIFRFLSRPGELNAAQAYALAVVLMAVTAVSIFLVDRIRVRRAGWL